MKTINVNINNIRKIKYANLELPFDNGIYAFVGSNGCGKSTLMECLSLLLPKVKDRRVYGTTDISSVTFEIENKQSRMTFNSEKCIHTGAKIMYPGLYEGSLFYGTRFEDSRIIETMIASGRITDDILAPADEYLREKISFILQGKRDSYPSLIRIKNKLCADKLNIKNRPYFIRQDNKLISQYRMSSGECLLISLMHFLYNSIVRRSLSKENRVLVLIDELELALHPIAVVRLLDFIQELVEEHPNLIVYLSSHSPEVIKKIPPSHLYKVNENNGVMTLVDNCYPSYLIRDLYSHVSPDYLLLVEDYLAQQFVSNIITHDNLRIGKMVHVVPVGGWANVLELHKELYTKKILGHNTKIISILDGDVKGCLSKDQKKLPSLFLPISSVEKYLYHVIKDNSDSNMRQIINDKYFVVDSLDTIVADFNKAISQGQKDTNKGFYAHICRCLDSMGTSEEVFISGLCQEILENIDTKSFRDNLKDKLNS